MKEKKYFSKYYFKKNKLLIFLLMLVIALILLLISNYYKNNNNYFLSNLIDFITGAFSIATIALTIITIISDYFDAKSNRICYLSNDSSFSYSIFSGISNSEEIEDYFVTCDMKCKDKDTDYLKDFFKNKAFDYSGVIVRFKFDDRDPETNKVFNYIKKYIDRGNKVVFADTGEQSIRSHLKEYVVVNSNLLRGGEMLAEEMNKVINKDSLVLFIDGPKQDLNLQQRIIGRNDKLKDIKYKNIIDNSKKLNKKNMFESLESFFVSNFGRLKKGNSKNTKLKKYKSIVIFCGNDKNAFDLMSTLLKNKEEDYKEVIEYFKTICGDTYDRLYIFGYDGLRKDYTINGENKDVQYKLSEFTNEFKYYSIDSAPIEIGKNAISELVYLMKHNRPKHNTNYSNLGTSSFKSRLWGK